MRPFYLFALLACASASAEAALPTPDLPGPQRGGFDWKKFEGKYEFAACRSSPAAIWSDAPPGTFVLIEHAHDYTRRPDSDSLNLMRANNSNPIALGWSLDHIGLGPQQREDPDTGRVNGAWESYPTADGIYGKLAWDNPHNVGWSTLRLKMDAQGDISYEIRQKTDSDAAVRQETCVLKPYAKRAKT